MVETGDALLTQHFDKLVYRVNFYFSRYIWNEYFADKQKTKHTTLDKKKQEKTQPQMKSRQTFYQKSNTLKPR